MPIYEYRCNDCEHEYDQLRSMRTMDDVRACPACGSMATARFWRLYAASSGPAPTAC